MPYNYQLDQEQSLRAKRIILAQKIAQERVALRDGVIGPASPAEYDATVKRTRAGRLAEWERMLLDLEEPMKQT